MATVYDLAVRLSFQSVGFGGVGSIVGQLAGLARQSATTQAALDGAGKSVAMIAGGAALTGIGLAGVGLMKGWVSAAGEMQDALTQVGNAASGTHAQILALQNASYTIAGNTQFSAPQILDMAKLMGTHGFNDPSGKLTPVAAISAALPEIARAAEVAYRMTGQSYQETVPAMVKLAHQFGVYSGSAFDANIDTAVRASIASGMSLTQESNVLRYLTPAAKSLGIGASDVFTLTALANQVGLTQGRGGSNLGALFRQILPGGSAKHVAALDEIERLGGGQFFGAGGNFLGVDNMLSVISRFEANDKNAQHRLSTLNAAFLAQGGQAAAALGSPSSISQLHALEKRLQPYDPIKNPTGIATVQDMQLKLNQTLVGQLNTLKTDIHSISAMMGQELLPAILPAIHGFTQLTAGVMEFTRTHPEIAKVVGIVTAIGTAASLVAGPILMVGGALRLLGVASMIGTAFGALSDAVGVAAVAFGALDIAAAPVLVPILAITAAVAGAIWAFTHWSDVTKTLGTVFSWVGDKLHSFLVWLGILQNGPDLSKREFSVPGLRGHLSAPGGFTGGGSAPTLHIHPGAIVVHGAPGQDEGVLAERVKDKLAEHFGDAQRWGSSMPYRTDLGWYGM